MIPLAPTDVQIVHGTESPHAYFEKWAALAADARSFRDQAQLDALCRARDLYVFDAATGTSILTQTPKAISPFWTYSPETDPHPRKQDAAKLLLPKRYDWGLKHPNGAYVHPALAPFGRLGGEGVQSKGALHIPIHFPSGTATFGWDLYWDESFQTSRGLRDAFKWLILFFTGDKLYQILHEQYTGSILTPAAKAAGALSHHHDDSEGSIDADMRWPDATARGMAPGVVTKDPWVPTNAPFKTREFLTYSNRWTRYLLQIDLSWPWDQFPEWEAGTGATMTSLFAKDAAGGPVPVPYDRVTLYIGDETRDLKPVLYRVPFVHALPNRAPALPGLQAFRFAFDSSTENQKTIDGVKTYDPAMGCTGDTVAYLRNWWMLRAGTDPSMFEVPKAG